MVKLYRDDSKDGLRLLYRVAFRAGFLIFSLKELLVLFAICLTFSSIS